MILGFSLQMCSSMLPSSAPTCLNHQYNQQHNHQLTIYQLTASKTFIFWTHTMPLITSSLSTSNTVLEDLNEFGDYNTDH